MAKPKKLPPPSDASKQLGGVETPPFPWRIYGGMVAAVAAGWVFAVLLVPYVSYWGLVVMGALTAAVGGLFFYAWNLYQKQTRLLSILRGATDEEGRKNALAALSGDEKDAMSALAKAQLVAREDPKAAIEILEKIDVAKAPTVAQDEVRAFLAQLYLFTGRIRDARDLTDQIKLDKAAVAKSRLLYAALQAEALARTGDAAEAKKILETYKPEGPDAADVAPMLYRAQVYTFFATKNRGLAKKAMLALASGDPNLIAPFLQKGTSPEMQAAAREVLSEVGYQTKAKMKMQRTM